MPTVMGKPKYNFCPNCGAKMTAEQTENCSEKPNNCDTCRHKGVEGCEQPCLGCNGCGLYEPTDEPQTDTEIAKAIVHKMIDDAVIAEDAYPDLRQKMHDAVDEYEPQTERSSE